MYLYNILNPTESVSGPKYGPDMVYNCALLNNFWDPTETVSRPGYGPSASYNCDLSLFYEIQIDNLGPIFRAEMYIFLKIQLLESHFYEGELSRLVKKWQKSWKKTVFFTFFSVFGAAFLRKTWFPKKWKHCFTGSKCR